MQINEVHFKKFSVEPKTIMASLPKYSKLYWPDDWTVVYVGDVVNADAVWGWSKEAASGSVELVHHPSGGIFVGFSDSTDAILFKLSYDVIGVV